MAEDAAEKACKDMDDGADCHDTCAEDSTQHNDDDPSAEEQRQKTDHDAGTEFPVPESAATGAHICPDHQLIPPFLSSRE